MRHAAPTPYKLMKQIPTRDLRAERLNPTYSEPLLWWQWPIFIVVVVGWGLFCSALWIGFFWVVLTLGTGS